jgi:hypothetical protein
MSVESTNLGTVVSWRVGGGLRGADPSGRFWRRGPLGRPGGDSSGRHAGWLAGAVLGLGIGLAMTFWLIALLRLPRPARLVLVGAGYRDNLQIPHNAYGWAGLLNLEKLGDRPVSSWLARLCGARYQRAGDPIVLDVRAKDRWGQILRNVPEPTIVVVMAMHGGVDREGAYLLPQDAKAVPESPDRLRMTDVLRAFAPLPRHKKKILILDATGLPYHWELGMIRNGFAGELAKLDPEIKKIPNLIVICASGEGERSWPSEAWGRTAFLQFLFKALEGDAPARTGGGIWPTGARVNLEQVCDDLSSRVNTWAIRHRGAPQQPLILPSGDGWRKVARSIELPSIRAQEEPRSVAGTADRSIEKAISDHWEDYRGLATSSVLPGVATPIPWRRYQQLLRRYDELLRAVGPEKVEEDDDVLGALESQRLDIKQDRTSRLTASRSATLTMPIAEEAIGSDGKPMDPASPGEAVRTWFEKTWWPAAEGEERKIWLDRRAKEAGGDARDLAAQLGELLLGRAIDDPAANLERAAQLARYLDSPPQRPAELNFLIMLRLGLPPDWKTTGHVDLVRRALRVRRLAERAALGLPAQSAGPDKIMASPLVAAWIVAKVDEGDRHRRQAEDMLMASDRREACDGSYGQAEAAYQAAIQGAEKVRRAILARDRALSDLVPITEWLAGWYPPADQVDLLRDLVDSTEDLWKKVHVLGRVLEVPALDAIDPPPTGNDGAARGVYLSAMEVEQAHATLKGLIENRLNLWVRATVESSQTRRSVFELRTLADALTLPWLGKDLRLSLLRRGLERLRERDREELVGSGGEDTGIMAASGGDDRLYGFRRRLALAILGSSESGGEPSTTAAQAEMDITETGRRIGARFEGRVEEIARLIGRDNSPRGAQWAANLARVDRLVRMLDGVSNERVYPQAGSADALRFLRLEDYLISQARRTRADLWHDEGSEAVPYDRRVAGAYLDDARDIDSRQRDARRDPIAEIRKGLLQADNLRIAGPENLIVTSEERSGLRYRVVADDQPDLRAGQAVTWFEAVGGFRIDQPANPASRRAVPLGGSAGPLELTLGFDRISIDPGAAPPRSTLLGRAYFRGRSLRNETIVERHPTPSRRIVRTPPPPGGGVTVRAEPKLIRGLGLGGGAVTIVLDASGSMRPPPGQQGPSKFQEATEALRSVLRHLPPGTIVSLWVFGEAMGDPKTADFAERTIRRVQKPVAWDTALLDPLMKEVAAIEPWNESPILRTMLTAADDLRGAAGYKTLLVLTDGMDNRWLIDRKANPDGLDVSASLRSAFAASDIAVNVVGFRVPTPAEREQVRSQFEGVKDFRASGLFATAEAGPALIDALERALQPALRFAIDGGENGPVPTPPPLGFVVQPAQAGSLGEPIPLSIGSYQLRLLTADQPRCRFLVDGGDWLLVRVLSTPVGASFERELYSSVAFGLSPARKESRSGWLLAAIQNQLLDGQKLRMMTTFEQRFDPRDPIIRQARPREIWFDVESSGAENSRPGTMIQVADLWGYPAPAWRIDVSGWPTAAGNPATPVLQAWWSADDEAIPSAVVDRGRDFTVNDDLSGYSASIDGQPVTIESVRVEEHEVEVGDGTKQRRSCLVVRMAYPKDNPVWARPYGIEVNGWEHRFYEDVGKYTGIFWPVTRDQADNAFRRLGLISVGSFRRDARRRGDTLRLETIGPPDPRDVGPMPIGSPPSPRPPEPLVRSGVDPRSAPAGAK